jgi:TRAP-type C4-dicarboxylate transport system permease small subunit
VRGTLAWLRARADNVSAALLAGLFAAFILQIVTRYVLNNPLSWTHEVCVTAWLWLVLWGSAFSLREHDQVRFDLIYQMVNPRTRRWFAIVSAAALFAGFAASLPASIDYITFYRIKRSPSLGIRLDVVFSVYAVFAVAVIVRSAWEMWRLLRGAPLPDDLVAEPDEDHGGAPSI